MKKAITILAVLIVLVGAVFAEEHRISVKTIVGEVIPSFQLKYGAAGVHTNTGADSNNITNKVYNGQYGTAQEAYTVAEAVDVQQDISMTDVTASFRAVLAIGGKQNNKSYTLAFAAGSFNTTHNGAADATACSQTSLNNLVGTTKQNVVISAATTDNPLTDGASKSTTITMKGAAAEEAIDLVEFTAKWPRNEDVDVGEYTADVTLTITANV